MLNYKTINFNKSATIFIEGQEPKYTFYIIKKGRVVVYSYFADNYTVEYKEGEIIGLFNAVLNEPYFSTVKALEDTEVIEMNINEIEKINTISLINKIYDYLIINIERWLNRYYYFLHKENNPYYSRHGKSKNYDIMEMCKIYLNNGFADAAYKLYKKYIELNPNDEERKEELDNLYKNIKPIEEPENIEADIYKYKKGYCPLDHIPPIFGKVGIAYLTDNGRGRVDFYTLYNGKKSKDSYNLEGEDNIKYATVNGEDGEGMPAWFTLNIKGSYSLNKVLTLQAGVENLLDTQYRCFASGINAPGRNIYAALRLKF